MKKSGRGLIITLLALFGIGYASYRIYAIKKAFQKPVIDPIKVGRISYKDGSINLYFDIRIENPNDIKILVNSIDLAIYDMKLNKLATIRNDKINTSINPKSSTKIKDIKGKIGAFEVFSFLLSNTSKYEYKIIGNVIVENFTIPINTTISATTT